MQKKTIYPIGSVDFGLFGALENFKVICGEDVKGEYGEYVHIPTIFSANVYMVKLVKKSSWNLKMLPLGVI